jgi:hypothetical protein
LSGHGSGLIASWMVGARSCWKPSGTRCHRIHHGGLILESASDLVLIAANGRFHLHFRHTAFEELVLERLKVGSEFWASGGLCCGLCIPLKCDGCLPFGKGAFSIASLASGMVGPLGIGAPVEGPDAGKALASGGAVRLPAGALGAADKFGGAN